MQTLSKYYKSNAKFPANWVTFTEEILNGKLHFYTKTVLRRVFGIYYNIFIVLLI